MLWAAAAGGEQLQAIYVRSLLDFLSQQSGVKASHTACSSGRGSVRQLNTTCSVCGSTCCTSSHTRARTHTHTHTHTHTRTELPDHLPDQCPFCWKQSSLSAEPAEPGSSGLELDFISGLKPPQSLMLLHTDFVSSSLQLPGCCFFSFKLNSFASGVKYVITQPLLPDYPFKIKCLIQSTWTFGKVSSTVSWAV